MKRIHYLGCNIILLVVLSTGCFAVNAQIFDVQKYGAKGNGTTDDRDSIAAAIEAAHKWSIDNSAQATVYFPATTTAASPASCYLIKTLRPSNVVCKRLRNYVFPVYSNMKYKGDVASKGASTLKFGDGLFSGQSKTDDDLKNGTGIYANSNMFYGEASTINGKTTRVSNVVFSNFTIDFNGVNNLLPPGQNNPTINNCNGQLKTIYGILMEGGSDVTIDNVTMLNNPGMDDIMMFAPGNKLTVQNSTFKNGGRNVGSLTTQNLNHYDFSFVYSEWDNSNFINNSVVQEYPEISLQGVSNSGGFEIHGSNFTVTGNYIKGCKPGMFIGSIKSALSFDFSVDNKPQENIRIENNKIIDCYRAIFFWVKNPINDVTISNNTITTMLIKKATLNPEQRYEKYANLAAIYCPNGNMTKHSDYEYQPTGASGNYSLNPLNNINITNNTISFDLDSDVPKPGYLTNVDLMTTGMTISSMQNSTIANNTITNMNFAGISIEGSPWGMKNDAITGNTISDFQYMYKPGRITGYILARDTYFPNNDCHPGHEQTFANISITGNTFTSNQVVNEEANACNGAGTTACFKDMSFDLPAWYGYASTKPYTFKSGTFTIDNSNRYFGNSKGTFYGTSPVCANAPHD
jgi:hypothetical protein